MPLTQQFARVSSGYLDRCRASALASSEACLGGDAAFLDRIRLDGLLSELSTSTEEAATACWFGAEFDGTVRTHLAEHFAAIGEFYRTATPVTNPIRFE
ncbi:hypothetical protein [Streptomyces sp. NPDC002276]